MPDGPDGRRAPTEPALDAPRRERAWPTARPDRGIVSRDGSSRRSGSSSSRCTCRAWPARSSARSCWRRADGSTATDLVETLQVSKGSISGMTQLLIHYALVVERTVRAGDRRDRFVIKSGALGAEMMLWRLELLQQTPGSSRSDGLELLGPDGDPGPLRRYATCTHSWNASCPLLIDRWEEQRRAATAEPASPAAPDRRAREEARQ